MRCFASSPVVLEVPWHGLVFGTGQEESSERLFDIVYFRKWDFSVPTIHTLFKVRVPLRAPAGASLWAPTCVRLAPSATTPTVPVGTGSIKTTTDYHYVPCNMVKTA